MARRTGALREHYPPELIAPLHYGVRLLKCFSVAKNIARLHSESKNECLAAIQGLRFLAMFGVVAGHCFFIHLQGAVTNVAFMEQRYHDWLSMLFINGHLIVSAFLVISGFLRAYNFLQAVAQNGRLSAGQILTHCLLRYIRLTLPLAVVMAVAATWLYDVGSGPLWHNYISYVADNCRHNWWTNVLYVNNYVGSSAPCLRHTWYLAVDSQLYLLSLPVLVLMCRWPRFTTPLLAASLVACVAVSFHHTYAHQLRATLLSFPTVLQNMSADDTYLRGYISTQSNAIAYFMGVTFGVVYHNVRTTKLNKVWIVKWWLLLLPLLIGPILSAYYFYQPSYEYSPLLESIYAAVYRIPFSYAVGSAIMLFALGYGWIVNDLLCSKPCIVFGRLTYAAYLVHFLWQKVEAGTRRTPFYLNIFQMTRAAFLDLLFSYIWGFFLCISIEMPATALIKYFTQENKSANSKSPVKENQPPT